MSLRGFEAIFMDYLGEAGIPSIILNVSTMVIGFLLAIMFKLNKVQAISISIGTGIQNGTLAITLATIALNNAEYSIVPAMGKRECNVAIPCKGDRRLAAAQDDEILFTIPPEMLPDFIEGTKFLQERNWGIPMIQEYKDEYDLKPGYKDAAERLGLDTKKSPPREQKYQKH